MKIFILTQPLGKNYGGNLQAYALQTILKKQGHSVITLDRRWNAPKLGLKLIILRALSSIKSLIFILLGRKRIVCNPFSREYNVTRDTTLLQAFCNKYITLSEPLYDSAETTNFLRENYADLFIVGSDQVWRRIYCPSLKDYFLEDLPTTTPRISYAASFGKDDIREYSASDITYVKPLLQKFTAISVRESSGIDICRTIFDVAANEVLDPTLLLSEQDYFSLIDSTKVKHRHHLAVYILDQTPEILNFVDKMANDYNLQVQTINVDEFSTGYVKFPSVEDWLANIAFSDYVITDSFHGMVFSLIFKKQFVIIGNKKRGISRYTSVLSKLGLEDRVILDAKIKFPTKPINYTEVSCVLERLRNDSLEWLFERLKQE